MVTPPTRLAPAGRPRGTHTPSRAEFARKSLQGIVLLFLLFCCFIVLLAAEVVYSPHSSLSLS